MIHWLPDRAFKVQGLCLQEELNLGHHHMHEKNLDALSKKIKIKKGFMLCTIHYERS